MPHTVKMGTETKIIVDMQYLKLSMKNAINKCLIRKEVLKRLLIACTYLLQGLSFKIYVYKPDIIKQFNLENLSFKSKIK
ncbi:MAG: M15 family metallopeptidase [Clostridia bacterium]|nr:M15 family metallopeptidase [Clostridia bacterium]